MSKTLLTTLMNSMAQQAAPEPSPGANETAKQ